MSSSDEGRESGTTDLPSPTRRSAVLLPVHPRPHRSPVDGDLPQENGGSHERFEAGGLEAARGVQGEPGGGEEGSELSDEEGVISG